MGMLLISPPVWFVAMAFVVTRWKTLWQLFMWELVSFALDYPHKYYRTVGSAQKAPFQRAPVEK